MGPGPSVPLVVVFVVVIVEGVVEVVVVVAPQAADPVGPEVTTRDSILLTYFVDAGPLRYLRNRWKRVGNFVLNESRSAIRG